MYHPDLRAILIDTKPNYRNYSVGSWRNGEPKYVQS